MQRCTMKELLRAEVFTKSMRYMPKLIAWVIAIRLIIFSFYLIEYHQHYPRQVEAGIFVITGDTDSYLLPIENLIDGKGYSLKDQEPFLGRTPGFLPIYGPLYAIMGQSTARLLLTVLQFSISILSIFILGKISWLLFQSERIVFFTIITYALSPFVAGYDMLGYSESFASAFLIFAAYFFLRSYPSDIWQDGLLAGLFLSWAIFLRPIFGLWLPLFPLIYLIHFIFYRKRSLIAAFTQKYIWSLGLVAVICFGAWIIRNQMVAHKFVPLIVPYSESYSTRTYSPEKIHTWKLIVAWGGDIAPWIPQSEAQWFFAKEETPAYNPFPDYIYTSTYNYDSLLSLRRDYWACFHEYTQSTLTAEARQAQQQAYMNRVDSFLDSYKSERAFYRYVVSPIRLFVHFVFPPPRAYGSPIPFPAVDQMAGWQYMTKAGMIVYYYLIVAMGFGGLLIMLVRKMYKHLLFLTLLISIIAVSVLMGRIEHRFMVPMYFWFCMLAAFLIDYLIQFRNRWINSPA